MPLAGERGQMKRTKKTAKQDFLALEVPRAVYSEESVRIAAHVIERRAQAAIVKSSRRLSVKLAPKRPLADAEAGRRLAGEFFNELLNQEYRQLVARFNRKISNLIMTQTLYAARGGDAPPMRPAPTPEFKAEVDAMLREAEEEIKRTMPKRIPPQGLPIPPAA